MINGHGDDTYKYKDIRINFSSNVYTHFDHEDLFCHLANKLDNVIAYPEPAPERLEAEMAMMLSIKPEEVCITNGATEGIYLIAQTFRRSKSAILMPTFSEYADACTIHEHQICSIYSLEEIPSRAQIVWLCNPNNPTGTVIDIEELARCVLAHPDTVFVIDTSYAPYTIKDVFTPKGALEFPNVLLIHSLTKEYAIPGLRIGYLTGNENLLTRVRLQRMPWSVNQVAIDAAHYLLRHTNEYIFDIYALIKERERIEKALSSLGVIEIWPSDTHILLCKLRMGNASALKEFLANEKGILIRDASNFAGLDSSFFRIAVQLPEENEELIEGIKEWISL